MVWGCSVRSEALGRRAALPDAGLGAAGWPLGVGATAAEPARRRRGRVVAGPGVRQGELPDRAERLAVLPVQRARGVRDAVVLAQLAHTQRDLAVPVARQVGEEVVLDLEAEVAAHDVQQRPALEVRGAEHLAEVPLRTRLVLDLLLG